jgi:hypothetical protein
LAGGCFRPHTAAFNCARLVFQGQRNVWEVKASPPPPPPHHHFPLRSTCLADGFLPRETMRLAGGDGSSHARFPLRSACLANGSLPRATRRLAGGGCRFHFPAFHCARIVLQAARHRGPAAPIPPLSAALGLSCRRLATAGNETLGSSCRHLATASFFALVQELNCI